MPNSPIPPEHPDAGPLAEALINLRNILNAMLDDDFDITDTTLRYLIQNCENAANLARSLFQ
jgi:hypothetical protein